MAHAHLAFELAGFEDPDETVAENINRIHGKALAEYVARELSMLGYTASDIWPEDHGWDFEASKENKVYLLACCVALNGNEQPNKSRNEAHITWSRKRSFFDTLRGSNALNSEDESIADLRIIAAKLDAKAQPHFDIA
ncbi:MAG: hypothetical protein AAFR75_00565 [Pseudomonadota bacterium]